MIQISVKIPFIKHIVTYSSNSYTVESLKSAYHGVLGATYVTCDGRLLDASDPLQQGKVYHVLPRLPGGKGGFGSMLRAIGAQIEKTTSREAMRDLSGRRMRDLNNEKKLREWVAKQADREQEKETKRQERLERRKTAQHKFDDPNYHKQKAQVLERLDDAVTVGLQNASSAGVPSTSAGTSGSRQRKRKVKDQAELTDVKRAAKEWLGMDVDLDGLSDLDSDSSSSDSESVSRSAGSGQQRATTASATVTSPAEESTGSATITSQTEESSHQEEPIHSSDSIKQSAKCKSESEDSRHIDTKIYGDSSSKHLVKNDIVSKQKSASDFKVPIKSEMQIKSKERNIFEIKIDMPDSAANNLSTGGSVKAQVKIETDVKSEPGVQACETSEEKDSSTVKKEVCVEASSVVGNKPAGLLATLATTPAKTEKSDAKETRMIVITDLASLQDYPSAGELEVLGLDCLKASLTALRLKCGGTLAERAQRLWSVRGLTQDEISPALRVKPSKPSKNKKKIDAVSGNGR